MVESRLGAVNQLSVGDMSMAKLKPRKIKALVPLPSDRALAAANSIMSSGPDDPHFLKNAWLVAQTMRDVNEYLNALARDFETLAKKPMGHSRSSPHQNMILQLREYSISANMAVKAGKVVTSHGRPMPRKWKPVSSG
jgi:hypothetical protein